MDINKFIFSRTQPAKKLSVINELKSTELESVSKETITRIVKEVGSNYYKSRDKELGISRERKVGNNWNSLLEYVSIIKKELYVGLYVQYGDCDTDTTINVKYTDFFKAGDFRGEIESTDRYDNPRTYYYTYDKYDKVECMRSILKEYIYTKYNDKL